MPCVDSSKSISSGSIAKVVAIQAPFFYRKLGLEFLHGQSFLGPLHVATLERGRLERLRTRPISKSGTPYPILATVQHLRFPEPSNAEIPQKFEKNE
jgi:hypothetical protein